MKTQPLDDVVAHWSKLYEGFHTSSEKFYDAVEDALERREVPGIAVSSLVLNEGGLLSPNRSYLRVRADRLIFDICAAPGFSSRGGLRRSARSGFRCISWASPSEPGSPSVRSRAR